MPGRVVSNDVILLLQDLQETLDVVEDCLGASFCSQHPKCSPCPLKREQAPLDPRGPHRAPLDPRGPRRAPLDPRGLHRAPLEPRGPRRAPLAAPSPHRLPARAPLSHRELHATPRRRLGLGRPGSRGEETRAITTSRERHRRRGLGGRLPPRVLLALRALRAPALPEGGAGHRSAHHKTPR